MKLARILGSFLALTLVASNAFAGYVVAQVNGSQVGLPSCGGTVQINNGGNNSQLNFVLRQVVDCSHVVTFDGRSYDMKQPQGQRGGSYTLANASQLSRGFHSMTIVITSNSGAHADTITVPFTVY